MILKKEVTCYILLDGFKPDYVKDTDFIKLNCKKLYSIEEAFGFQSFRPAVFAGVFPEDTGICWIWIYSPFRSPYKILRNLVKLFPERLNIFLKKITYFPLTVSLYLLKNILLNKTLPLYSPLNIPFNLLPFFDISEKKMVYEEGYINNKTLFDLLRENKKEFIYIGYPNKIFTEKNYSLKELSEKIEDKKPSFIFLHMNVSDRLGHKYGPSSGKMRSLHKIEDEFVKNTYNLLKKKYRDVNLIVAGDHGMVDVKSKVDIWKELKKSSLVLGNDYVVFLDSSMARFWFSKEHAKNEIETILKGLGWFGKTLNKKDKRKYNVRFNDRRQGDLIWVANPGVLISPNFHSAEGNVKGMHGYLPSIKENKGFFMIKSEKKTLHKNLENIKMVDIFPTLCELLEIEIPKSCRGKSLLKNDD